MPAVGHEGVDVHYRAAGAGPPAVLLHSGGGASGQWRALMDRLAPEYRVIAPDFYGHGKTPPWPGDGDFTLDDEAALVEAVMPDDEPAHLIAHSYGASVAMQVAKRAVRPMRRLVLIEPTLFALLRGVDDAAWQGVLSGGAKLIDMVAAGEPEAGAARFMDYLFGDGSWAAMPKERQAALVAVMPSLSNDTKAQIAEGISAADYAGIETRTLLIYGAETPRDIRRTCEIVAGTLPDLRTEIVAGAGHMVPVTHAETVNGIIGDFLGT